MQVMRIVVVGCGSIGRRHARNLAARPDVQLELCEPVRTTLDEALREVGNVPVHDNLQSMLATKPQLVVVATPHSLHAEHSIAALESGAHVLCEKPMSDSLESAQRMASAARRTGQILDVGFTLHFHPGLQRIKQMIAAGELGRISHVHWHVGTYTTLINSVSRHQSKTFGALMMDYAHQPDIIHWWLGAAPSHVHAFGCMVEEMPLKSPPNVMAITMEYAAPVVATINLNYVQHPEQSFCQVVGDAGWASLDMKKSLLQHGRREQNDVQEECFEFERDDMFRAEHEAFIQAAAGKRAAESPPEAAIQSMRVVDAAIQSLRTKTPSPLVDLAEGSE